MCDLDRFSQSQSHLLKEFYMNDPLEHDVNKPVNISQWSCLVSLASYFCGNIGFREFILIKMLGILMFVISLTNLMDVLTECYVLVIYPWQDYI